jgi:hypothetical protein
MDQQPPTPPQQDPSLFEMELDAAAQNHLNTMSKWGKFIGITLLVILILCLVGMAASYREIIDRLAALMSLSNAAVSTLIAIFAVIGVLCIVWLVYLLRSCSLIKEGLLSQNSDRIAEGFKALKTMFTISIIFSILSILATLFTMIKA